MSFPHLTFAHIFALKKQDMSDFSFTPPTSVVPILGTNKATAFAPKTSEVFKEEHNIAPININIINPIESDSKPLNSTWSPTISATNS